MRQSRLFTKTLKESPSDEQALNAQLLIRAGYIHKEMAGAYMLLPLGLRVVEKIKTIVREEMDKIGGQEFITTSMQKKELWEKTGRWSDDIVDVWFKSKLKAGGEIGFAWSHEEPIANMMKNHISSYKDLPIFVYQFQNKLRNELRAKSGIMRGREFIMKDMYSFTDTKEQHDTFYESSKEAYMKVFERLGIANDTYITYAAGGAFTEFSHEFQTLCNAGEDMIYLNKEKGIAINEEILTDDVLKEMYVTKDELELVPTAEVGNIFNFGRSKAEEVGLFYNNADGKKEAVWMGSYGIGITRLMGVLVEKFSDKDGIIWPKNVAPYSVHLIAIGDTTDKANELYKKLQNNNIDTLYDDRDARPGQKFADSDLIGIPTRVVISSKSIEAGGVEIKERAKKEAQIITEEKLFTMLNK